MFGLSIVSFDIYELVKREEMREQRIREIRVRDWERGERERIKETRRERQG